MKIHIDSTLAKIEQLFQNLDQKLNQEQFIRLQYKLKGYKEKKLGQDQMIIETNLIDGIHSQVAILAGKAANLINIHQNEQFINVNSMVIQLLRWKVVHMEKQSVYLIVIYEFQYIASIDGEYECTQYKVDQNIPAQAKIKLSIQKNKPPINNLNNLSWQPNTSSNKKVKIENQSFTKDSFIIDDNLLNISALDTPANNKQQILFKDYQQKQQILQQDFTKISAMYPNMKNWVLEGRIIFKSQALEYRCKKTETVSKYFRILVVDCEQEMITGLFYEKALNKFFGSLQEGKVFTFKNGCIGQDKTNGTKKITFNEYSIIQESFNFAIPVAPQLNFQHLKEIESLQHNSIVDVIVIIQEIKQDSEICKSFIALDQTARLSVKLWGSQYTNLNLVKGEIIVFKGLKFQNSNFKSLNSDYQTLIIQNQDLNEVKQLKSWLAGKNLDTIMKQNQDNQTIDLLQLDEHVIKLLNEGKIEQATYKNIYGYIIEINEVSKIYPSCPNIKCKSKMDEITTRMTFRCKKCLIENNSPKFSFVLRVTIMDEYTSIRAVIFDEVAIKLLGLTADQFRSMSPEDQKNIYLSKAYQQKKMKVQIQFKNFNGQNRPQYTVQEIVDIQYKHLALQAIEKFDEVDNLLNLSLLL